MCPQVFGCIMSNLFLKSKKYYFRLLQNLPFLASTVLNYLDCHQAQGRHFMTLSDKRTILHSKFFPLNVIIFSLRSIAVNFFSFFAFKKLPFLCKLFFLPSLRGHESIKNSPNSLGDKDVGSFSLSFQKCYYYRALPKPFSHVLCLIKYQITRVTNQNLFWSQKINTFDLEILTPARLCKYYLYQLLLK